MKRTARGMKQRKARLTVTVDSDLVAAGDAAVAEGRAESLSAWVNAAMAERKEKERRLLAMAEALADYERQYGAISVEEVAAQRRHDQRAAVVVRGGQGGAHRGRGRAA